MSESFADRTAERKWAVSHFRDYLFHRLSEEDDERVHEALGLVAELADDLDAAEQMLIRQGLDHQLSPTDQADFDKYYVNGTERNRIKLKIERCLRLPDARVPVEPVRPGPVLVRRAVPVAWVAATAAAILLCAAVVFWFARDNARLKEEIARKSHSAPNEPPEQLAGRTPDGGFVLPAAQSGIRLRVPSIPDRLIWTPVPDYNSVYRMRIATADGRQVTSSALTPSENAIVYAPERPSALPLPWEVQILGPGGTSEMVAARYFIVKP